MEKVIERRELALINCAREVEANEVLTKEMMEWEEATSQDGLNEPW